MRRKKGGLEGVHTPDWPRWGELADVGNLSSGTARQLRRAIKVSIISTNPWQK